MEIIQKKTTNPPLKRQTDNVWRILFFLYKMKFIYIHIRKKYLIGKQMRRQKIVKNKAEEEGVHKAVFYIGPITKDKIFSVEA